MKRYEKYIPYVLFSLLLMTMAVIGVIDKEDFKKIYHGKNSLVQKYGSKWENEFGEQLVLIYIGSSTCWACNEESLPQLVEDLKVMLAQKSWENAFSFKVMGVSKDWVVIEGIKHLNKFGEFDEISTGNNWVNSTIMKYVWQDYPGEPATPQLVLAKRKISNHGAEGMNLYMVDEEEIIARKIGLTEIERWHQQKAPIPDF